MTASVNCKTSDAYLALLLKCFSIIACFLLVLVYILFFTFITIILQESNCLRPQYDYLNQ